jgi:hypothetical protein
MKEIFAPHLNRTVKMGRRRPAPGAFKLKARDYLNHAELPAVPAAYDYSPAALSVLHRMFLNDALGDCVCAAAYHVVGVETGNAGDLFAATDPEVQADYSAIGGYVPGDPSTDQGLDEVTALTWWVKNGFADGTKPLGWLEVDGTNVAELQACIYLFEHAIYTLECPDAYVDPFPSDDGFVWDVEGDPVPENGHCVMGASYDAEGTGLGTWGMVGAMTYTAIAKYCVENAGGGVYVILTPDQIAKASLKAPNGVAWTSLIQDFDALGGTVPVPAPATPPVVVPPAPVPMPPTPVQKLVTLAEAQSWAIAGFRDVKSNITPTQARNNVTLSLAKHWPRS